MFGSSLGRFGPSVGCRRLQVGEVGGWLGRARGARICLSGRRFCGDEGRTRHATAAQTDSGGAAAVAGRGAKVKGAGQVNWRQYTIGHKGMPNIDTCSAHEVLLPTGPGPQYVGTPAGGGRRRPVGFATNGNFYTANDLQPRAQAAVVVDGRITFVGDSPDALRRASPGARRLDLHGTTVLPGLTDAHATWATSGGAS